jgi:hypothetical protein
VFHAPVRLRAAVGQEAFDAAVAAMLDDARGWRLAEMRKRRGMTQEQVAALAWNPLYEQSTLGVILLLAVGGDAWSRLRTT